MPELVRYVQDRVVHKKTPVKIDRKEAEHLGTGLTEGTVHRVGITLVGDKGKTRDVRLAEKVFDHPDFTPESRKEAISKYLKTHTDLKNRGLPTIPTMRTEVGNDQSIFMTDLTQNGNNEVVSVPDWRGGPDRQGKFYHTDHKVPISNGEQLNQSLVNLFDRMIETGCEISYQDVFFMIIDKTTREARVILGDLSDINFIPIPESVHAREIFMDNTFEVFRGFILEMRKHTIGNPELSMKPLLEARRKYLNEYRRLKDNNQ